MSKQKLLNQLPITIDKNIMGGAPVFTGSRVPVQTLFDYVLDGYTLDQFLDYFPTVRREDAVRVLQVAGEYLLNGVLDVENTHR